MLQHIGYIMFGGALTLTLAALAHAVNDGRARRGLWREIHQLRDENARLSWDARQLRRKSFADTPGDAATHVQRVAAQSAMAVVADGEESAA